MKDETGFDRKVKVEIEISPTALKVIAGNLERGISANINWYGVQILFKPEPKNKE